MCTASNFGGDWQGAVLEIQQHRFCDLFFTQTRIRLNIQGRNPFRQVYKIVAIFSKHYLSLSIRDFVIMIYFVELLRSSNSAIEADKDDSAPQSSKNLQKCKCRDIMHLNF